MKKVLVSTTMILMMLMANAAFAEPTTLKFATMDPAQSHPVTMGYKPWLDSIVKESGGTLKIEIYPGGTLGRDPRMQLKLVMDGVADMAFIVTPYTPGRFPDDEVFDLPFMAKTGLESAVASQRLFKKGMLSGYDDLFVLGHYTTSVYYLHTNFPARRPEDLKGHKFRATNKLQADIFKKLGAISVGMPIPKTAENISRGVIEGTICDLSALLVFRINGVAKHHLMVPFGCTALAVVMNKSKYESLPPKAKAALDKRGPDIVTMWPKAINAHIEIGMKKMKADPTHTFVNPTEENLNQWKRAIEPVTMSWKGANPRREKLVEAYQKELEAIRAGSLIREKPWPLIGQSNRGLPAHRG